MKICPWPVCMSYTKDILSAQPVSTFDLNHITGYQKYLYNKIILKQLLLIYKNISKQFKINALVIFVTTGPTPGIGQGIAVEMSAALTKVLPRQCRGNTRGLLYVGKKGCEMKRTSCWGKQQCFYQRAVPAGWGF